MTKKELLAVIEEKDLIIAQLKELVNSLDEGGAFNKSEREIELESQLIYAENKCREAWQTVEVLKGNYTAIVVDGDTYKEVYVEPGDVREHVGSYVIAVDPAAGKE